MVNGMISSNLELVIPFFLADDRFFFPLSGRAYCVFLIYLVMQEMKFTRDKECERDQSFYGVINVVVSNL